ncbi:MAG TPA: hypothetical protein VNA24_18055 [Hyalangium sp.]|nr:hypothetical protein [Hyalangium sp.]
MACTPASPPTRSRGGHKGREVTATPPRALKYNGPSPVKRATASVDSSHAPAEVAAGSQPTRAPTPWPASHRLHRLTLYEVRGAQGLPNAVPCATPAPTTARTWLVSSAACTPGATRTAISRRLTAACNRED